MYEQTASMAKQMIDLQRVSVEGIMSSAVMFWDHAGNIVNSFLAQAAWIPEEGKKACREWIDSNRKGCETLKDAVADGYTNLGKFFEKSAASTL